MSAEAVCVVRAYNEPYDGRDMAAVVREFLTGAGPADPESLAAAVKREVATNPVWRHLDVDIVWDLSAAGAVGSTHRGFDEVARYWVEWAGVWEAYTYRVREYRDLGERVLTVADVEGRAHNGLEVGMTVFQLWEVRDGKITSMRAFLSEADALDAL